MKSFFWLAVVGVLLLSLHACRKQVNYPGITPTISRIIISSPSETSSPMPTNIPEATATPEPSVLIHSGEVALFNGDWETALQEFQDAKIINNDPVLQSSAKYGEGRSRLMERNYYEAIKTFEEFIEEYPDSTHIAHAYFFLGKAYSAQERYYDAADAFLNYLALRPGIIDAYILDMRGDVQYAAGDYSGAALDYQAALLSPSLLDEIYLKLKSSRALALSGDPQTALVIYDDIYQRTNNENTRALIDLRKGEVLISLGRQEEAVAAYLDAVNNFPTAYESYLALIELIDSGIEVNELQRGIVDYYAGQYGVASAAFDRYLQNNPIDPASAIYFYGLTTRGLGGYIEAIDWWDEIIKGYSDHRFWDDAYEQKAYTQWAYMEDFTGATQTLLNFIEKASGHPRAAEFLFDAALIAERGGDLAQAAELHKKIVNQYPNYEQASRSMFLSGINYYRLGDYPSAVSSFQRYLSLVTALEERAAAHFWIAKSQNSMGDITSAESNWRKAAEIDPTGYYSERARDILHNREPFTPPIEYDLISDAIKEKKKAETWIKTTFALPDNTDFSGIGSISEDPRFQRGRELWDLGLYNNAREEFENLRREYQLDAVQSYRLANYFANLGAYRLAILTTRQILDLAKMDDATTLSAPVFFNHLRFGTYYLDLIMPLTQDYGFHPLFIFSVIRQESLFDSYVKSSADARGLMQIIPPTGEEIAENLGWPSEYSSEDLFRPEVNLSFGVEYLDAQRNAFNGNLYAALAAYNGGPGNAEQWYKLAEEDSDLLLELIRFPETRNYIRGIYEIFNIYRFVYDRSP